MEKRVFFEDIVVGAVERFGHATVTREDALAFAAKYDPQPFHLDDEAAAQSHFGRLAISGWQTCSMGMAMLVAYFDEIGLASMGGAGIDELRWVKPVYPGDTLSMQIEVLDKRVSKSRPDMGLVRQHVTMLNQYGEVVETHKAVGLVEVREPQEPDRT